MKELIYKCTCDSKHKNTSLPHIYLVVSPYSSSSNFLNSLSTFTLTLFKLICITAPLLRFLIQLQGFWQSSAPLRVRVLFRKRIFNFRYKTLAGGRSSSRGISILFILSPSFLHSHNYYKLNRNSQNLVKYSCAAAHSDSSAPPVIPIITWSRTPATPAPLHAATLHRHATQLTIVAPISFSR